MKRVIVWGVIAFVLYYLYKKYASNGTTDLASIIGAVKNNTSSTTPGGSVTETPGETTVIGGEVGESGIMLGEGSGKSGFSHMFDNTQYLIVRDF